MARSNKVFGPCHICGIETNLSFEHLPPAASGNNRSVKTLTMQQRLANPASDVLPSGTVRQRGFGKHSLCPSCNSTTGAWYANELNIIAAQASMLLTKFPISRLDANPQMLTFPWTVKSVRPLRFLKQIVTMLLSVNRASMGTNHPDLVSFVRNRDQIGLPTRYAFYLSFFGGPSSRMLELMPYFHFATRTQMNIAELAFPPFIYTMTVDSPRPPLPCGDISFFKEFGLDEKTDLYLPLLVAFTHTPLPGDYRSRAAIGDEIAPWKVL